jgi:hypothetical protein
MTRWSGPVVTGTVNGIDFDGRFTVADMPGVAFWLHGWAQEDVPESWELVCTLSCCEHDTEDCYLYSEPETVDDMTRVRAVMVGDDREHTVDTGDLTPLPDDGYCRECGQTGCMTARYE